MIEHCTGRGIKMRQRRGMSQEIAVHAARVVIRNDQTGRASAMINLWRGHHEPMPGQPIDGSADGPRQLKYFRVQEYPRILGAGSVGLGSRNVGTARQRV